MWPDAEFAGPRGSFLRPVPLPLQDPGALPVQTIQVNCNWLPVIRGALMQLLLQATWQYTDPADLQRVQDRVFLLISYFSECTGSALAFACPYDFEASQGPWFPPTKDDRFDPQTFGTYVGGSGWQRTVFRLSTDPDTERAWTNLGYLFTATTINRVEVVYDLVKGTFDTGGLDNTSIELYNGGSLVDSHAITSSTDPDGHNKTLVWEGSVTADGIFIAIETEYAAFSGLHGTGTVKRVIVNGEGIPLC